jgi:uncharacterized protein YrzB (UPF0473 family)
MEKNPIDRLFDENDSDPIILYGEDGQEIAFEQIAMIPLEGRVYVIMQPVELLEGMADDEALVFEILNRNGETVLDIVLDDEIIDAVFTAYGILFDEANGG